MIQNQPEIPLDDSDAWGWLTTVNRMGTMPGADISETDAQTIVAYMAAQTPSPDSGTGMQMEVAHSRIPTIQAL